MTPRSFEAAAVETEVDRIRSLGIAALRARWRLMFGGPPPTGLTKDIIRRLIAYCIQEKAFGSLGVGNRRRLRQLARGFALDPTAPVATAPTVKPGTRFVRQWQGQMHVVTSEAEGYEYRGSRYQSLSEIARLITGTRWSGPLFFGLRRKQNETSNEAM